MKSHFLSILLLVISNNIIASEVEVINVQSKSQGDQKYHFDVTLKHTDEGWDHYANRWEILDTQGKILATRTLSHPHVNEQPFTRSLTTKLPEHIKTIIVRGHDSVHKYGGEGITVNLP